VLWKTILSAYDFRWSRRGGKRLGGRFIDRVGLAASAVNAVLTAHVAVARAIDSLGARLKGGCRAVDRELARRKGVSGDLVLARRRNSWGWGWKPIPQLCVVAVRSIALKGRSFVNGGKRKHVD
jgi:hypothetical protein